MFGQHFHFSHLICPLEQIPLSHFTSSIHPILNMSSKSVSSSSNSSSKQTAATKLDNNCGSPPTVDGNYVYFQGGDRRNELWRRNKDGTVAHGLSACGCLIVNEFFNAIRRGSVRSSLGRNLRGIFSGILSGILLRFG